MTAHFAAVCASRRSCATCRASAAWRQFMGAPAVCPFGVGAALEAADDIVRDIHGNIIPVVSDETPDACRACPKFAPPNLCGKCGCASERLRPVEDILACPIKKFIRPPGWASRDGRKTRPDAL